MPLPTVIRKIIDYAEQQIDLNNQGIMDEQIEELVNYINEKPSKLNKFNLILFNNNLSDACLKQLSKLLNVRSINLSNNNISGKDINFLCSNSNIESINLTNNPLTRNSFEQLAENSKQTIIKLGEKKNITPEIEKKLQQRLEINKQNRREIEKLNEGERNLSLLFPKSPEMKLKGELLESFIETIIGVLEDFTDIQNSLAKNLLTYFLYDPENSAEFAAKFASEIEPALGERFAIIYCAMYPNKWEEPWMRPYKSAMLDSYLERSSILTSEISEQIKQLKKYCNEVVNIFLQEKNTVENRLDPHEEKIFKRVSEKAKQKIQPNDSLSDISNSINLLKKLIDDEGPSWFKDPSSIQKLILLTKQEPSFDKLSKNSWQLNKYDEHWPRIYELVKETPTRRSTRSEDKMLQAIRGILYKLTNKCTWSELPQSRLPQTMVKHYYYEWLNNGIIDKIQEQMLKEEKALKK